MSRNCNKRRTKKALGLLLFLALCVSSLFACHTFAFFLGEGQGIPCYDDDGCPEEMECNTDLEQCYWPEDTPDASGPEEVNCIEGLENVIDCQGNTSCITEMTAEICDEANRQKLLILQACVGNSCSQCGGGYSSDCNLCVANECSQRRDDCMNAECE